MKKSECVFGRIEEDQCYPVNKNIRSILGTVVFQEPDSRCGAAGRFKIA